MRRKGLAVVKKDIFDAARLVSSVDVAERAGIRLKKNGRRYWSCCCFHDEKTPSMMYDENGRFHCFGCGADGDGIDLYMHLYGVDKLTAARELAGEKNIPHRANPQRTKRREAEEPVDENGISWGQLCDILHGSAADMEKAEPGSEAFWKALAIHVAADAQLDRLGEELNEE